MTTNPVSLYPIPAMADSNGNETEYQLVSLQINESISSSQCREKISLPDHPTRNRIFPTSEDVPSRIQSMQVDDEDQQAEQSNKKTYIPPIIVDNPPNG
ncbi:hypothetical protein CDAR_399081 [Caerostris darwini]|uniref:Uncharacterized protein n=1 Tax=Caerostris darwini TaxID=1538125 RepID=A0AAV4SXI9_9ARAC|nr:hypothetical protein CDAR_399081 [Caerostris darwini]